MWQVKQFVSLMGKWQDVQCRLGCSGPQPGRWVEGGRAQVTRNADILLVADLAALPSPACLQCVRALDPRRRVATRRGVLMALDARYLIRMAQNAFLDVDLARRTVTLQPGYGVWQGSKEG